MTYTASTRDRYRLAVWTTTAAVAAGAVTATGWVAGAAAQQQDRADAAEQARQDAQARKEYDAWLAAYGDQAAERPVRTVVRHRPTRTRVTTRYVTASATTSVGAGGTVSTPAPSAPPAPAAGTSGTSGSGGSGGASTPAPPPPPPPPAPAPSSGS